MFKKLKFGFNVFINLLDKPSIVLNQTIIDVRWYKYKIWICTKDHKLIFILFVFKKIKLL